MFRNANTLLGVVGLGLIGGSLSLDLQALGYKVHGLVSCQETIERARERKLATEISTDPNILLDCDLIILAHPLKQLLEPPKKLLESLPLSSVITDVGSVKSPVLEKWQDLHPRFVASHPMAGRSESGIEAGVRGLFKARPWIATPNHLTDPIALDCVRKIAESIGSHWLIADARAHDQAVALVSHMPLFISAALIKTVSEDINPMVKSLARALASSGFADTSRIGGGEPHLGTGMAQCNTEELIHSIATYRQSLERLEELISTANWPELYKELEHTQKLRPEFL
ncbi:prephenate dehydrogenase (chromatophore) [Paulinella micropora]|uniref:Prephenate dehydrogenase n=1 Tax=Paulinella micropora TaxID=1928728 RepID=A0A1S6YIK4_9EUKA|nr:prephenate dehydrogenase [Paulinella micropora]BBL86348.1 prephenate dehydrogenase [Paulinella micropora]